MAERQSPTPEGLGVSGMEVDDLAGDPPPLSPMAGQGTQASSSTQAPKVIDAPHLGGGEVAAAGSAVGTGLVRERISALEGAAAQSSDGRLLVKVSRGRPGDEVTEYKLEPFKVFEGIMQAWCQQQGLADHTVGFAFEGRMLLKSDTPLSRGCAWRDMHIVAFDLSQLSDSEDSGSE